MNAFRDFMDRVTPGGLPARAMAGGDFALFASIATGGSGIHARKSVCPLGFILPGFHIENSSPSPLIPIQTNTVPPRAQAAHCLLSVQIQPNRSL